MTWLALGEGLGEGTAGGDGLGTGCGDALSGEEAEGENAGLPGAGAGLGDAGAGFGAESPAYCDHAGRVTDSVSEHDQVAIAVMLRSAV